ncbi:MAG: hypothetical protein F4X72_07775 [Dehalococcoidia bacterium]|nr:hypothetical protein [Dehalococcoidia bacterium]
MATETREVVYRALSLGAGVQSSVLALLLSQSDPRLMELGYSKPDAAIFADTGWEPEYVYVHLAWLEEQLDYPLIRVSSGDIRANLRKGLTASGHRFVDVPFYLVDENGKKGMLRRQCTNHYKIVPIYKRIRKLAGGVRGRPFPQDRHVEMWLGISLDEVGRMKPSREPWVSHRWPLVDLGMTRRDCAEWFASEYPGRTLPRSACVICPYRSDEHWMELKRSEPDSYDAAVKFDRWLRNSTTNPVRELLDGRPYLHSARRPLATVIAEKEKDPNSINHFNEECEGLCGV